MRFASPPVGGIVYRSPSSSNTIVCPSGDTSSEIQVPSDVVKSTLRVVFKGNESGRWAARGRLGATAARSIAVESLRITGLRGRQRWRAGNGVVSLEALSTHQSDREREDKDTCDDLRHRTYLFRCWSNHSMIRLVTSARFTGDQWSGTCPSPR